MVKGSEGITLVALVITIIVLIILVGVSVNTMINEGIIKKSGDAVGKYRNAQDEENTIIEQYAKLIDDYAGDSEITRPISAEEISFTPSDTNWKVENVKEALDYLYNN